MEGLGRRFVAQTSALRTPVGRSAIVFVLLAAYVVWHGRQAANLAPFSVQNVATALLTGLAIGALSALYATGIVVVYTTTGIFNFAQAAIGAFAAFVYWQLSVEWDWPVLPSLALVIFVIAPLIGLLMDRLIMRKLEDATLVIQLLVTVGVMFFILSATGHIWKQDQARSLPAFYGTRSFDLGPINITYHRAIVLLVAVLVAIALKILFRSNLGVAMRAVVDNRELVGLTGTNPDRISAVAWAIGAMLGAIAGILIAPELELDPANLNAVLVAAFAAAAFGQMRKLSLTLLGALLIGVGQQFTRSFLRFGDWPFAADAIAPVVLLFVVVALPQSRLEVGRVARNLKQRERTTKVWEAALGGAVLILVFVALSGGWLNFGLWDPGAWNQVAFNRMNVALSLALVGMSLVPLTGWVGQLNFAPMAFAGFGAFLLLKLANGSGAATISVWWLPVIGLLCAPLGALVAVTAARLRGLYLALASIAFAQLMALLFFPHPSIGFSSGATFKPFTVFGLDLSGRRSLMLFAVSVFAIFMIAMVTLRRSRYGRRWVALSDSQTASATVGVKRDGDQDNRVRRLSRDGWGRRCAVRHRQQHGRWCTNLFPRQQHPDRAAHGDRWNGVAGRRAVHDVPARRALFERTAGTGRCPSLHSGCAHLRARFSGQAWEPLEWSAASVVRCMQLDNTLRASSRGGVMRRRSGRPPKRRAANPRSASLELSNPSPRVAVLVIEGRLGIVDEVALTSAATSGSGVEKGATVGAAGS